ncbi:hypothetical protein Q9189_000324 [Teloschistes chrysophthalmus]
MSQMKIWKVVKRRREEKATERLRHEKLQEEAEVAIGKEIEERNAQNRVLWESAYNSRHGNDRHVDSGISMTITNPRKGLSSTNILSQGVVSRASIELKELEGDDNITEGTSKSGPKDKTRAIVTVAVASDDENLGITSAPASVLNENQSLSPVEIGPSQESDPSLVKTEEVETDRLSSAPNAVPLPFEIPSSDSNADRRSSIAASLASDHFSTRVLNRLSGGSPRRASSQRSQRSYTAISTSEEAVMIPHDDEDDGTSSVAANVDEISDGQHSDADKTTSGILAPPDAEENKVRKSSPSIEAQPTDRPGHELSKDQASSPSAIGMDAEAPQAFIAKHEPIAGGEPSGLAKTPEDVLSCKEGQRSSSPTNSIEAKTPPASESAKAEPALRDRLADLSGTSKVMMVYRTNEWAKHLEDAEKPTMDDWIAEHSAVAIPTEKPAPINISALQQTALNASPAPVTPPPNLTQPPPITKPKHQSAYPNQQGPPNPYPSLQRKSSANPSFDRHPSHSSLNSLPSQRATRPPHPHRTSHPPLPIEEDVPSTTKHNRHSTPPNPQALSNPYPSLQHKLSSSIRHPSSSVRHASYSSLDTLPSQRTSYPPPLQTRPQQTRPSQTLHRSKYRRRASAPLLVHPPIEEGVPSTTFPDRGVTAPAFPINTTTTATRSNARVSQHLLTYTPNGMPVPSSHPTLHQHQHHPHHQQQQQQKRRQESYRGTAFMVPSSAYLPSPSTPSPSASAPALVGRRSASGKGLEERHREAMRRLQMRASFGG